MWCKHQLGELARNEAAFAARGVALVGISLDAPAASQQFAADYGIGFPLLADEGGQVSAAYVGLDGADIAVPGIVIVDRTGEIRARQTAYDKADRPSAAGLLAMVDRALGTSGAPGGTHGFGALERVVVGATAGGGVLREAGALRATGIASLGAGYPVSRHLLVGAKVGGELRESPLDVAGTLTLRLPMWHATAAVQLEASAGWSPFADAGWNAGARVAWWVALTPNVALAVGGGSVVRGDVLELAATFGVARLFEVR